MIDLGLTKLALIGAVALIVIGPKELPKVARMAGTLFGRAQRYISQVKAEVGREIEMEELRKMQQEVQTAVQDVEKSVSSELAQTEQELNTLIHPEQDNYAYFHDREYAYEAYVTKAKDFRRNRLSKVSNIPMWYKNRQGQRSRVMSGAARMAKYRAKPSTSVGFF